MEEGEEGGQCAICGGGHIQPIEKQPIDSEYGIQPERRLRVVQCRDCGSRFVYPRPTVEELISFYPLHYHAYNEDHGWIARSLVAMRAKSRAKALAGLTDHRPIRLFDVGTGDCRHFEEMSRYGEFQFAGVEMKPEMVKAARARGYRVESGTLEELDITPYQNSFDIVTLYQLVEHVLEPQLLFRKAFQLLRPGGAVLGQLPCMDSFERKIFRRYWAGYHYPRHLQMFTQKGLNLLVERAGFRQVAITSALHLQAGLSLQNFLIERLGYRPRMSFGKSPIYSLLLLIASPFCLFEYLCGRGGMMNFKAKKC